MGSLRVYMKEYDLRSRHGYRGEIGTYDTRRFYEIAEGLYIWILVQCVIFSKLINCL